MSTQDLDFRPGLGVQSVVGSKFGLSVSAPLGGNFGSFVLVVSFGRCKFRLSEDSVGKILQATIGGVVGEFRSVQLDDQVFSFSVSAKSMGIHIYNLRSYECDNYKLFFHLWGQGGTSWIKEWQIYEAEEENGWQVVRHKGAKKTYADALKSTKLTGANAIPVNARKEPPVRLVFDRLQFQRALVFDRLEYTKNTAGD